MKAFPNHRSEGMELRDYFAAKAITVLVRDGAHIDVWLLAQDAYKIADAMMKAKLETRGEK